MLLISLLTNVHSVWRLPKKLENRLADFFILRYYISALGGSGVLCIYQGATLTLIREELRHGSVCCHWGSVKAV